MDKIIKKNEKTNTYFFRASLGKDENGKRYHPSRSGFKTKKEAENCLAKLRVEFDEGTYVKAKKITFLDFIKEWFEFYCRNVEKTTVQNRWPLIKNHIIPYFEGKRLDQITPRMLDIVKNLEKDYQERLSGNYITY